MTWMPPCRTPAAAPAHGFRGGAPPRLVGRRCHAAIPSVTDARPPPSRLNRRVRAGTAPRKAMAGKLRRAAPRQSSRRWRRHGALVCAIRRCTRTRSTMFPKCPRFTVNSPRRPPISDSLGPNKRESAVTRAWKPTRNASVEGSTPSGSSGEEPGQGGLERPTRLFCDSLWNPSWHPGSGR